MGCRYPAQSAAHTPAGAGSHARRPLPAHHVFWNGRQRRSAVQRDLRHPAQPLRQHRAAGEEEVRQQHVRAKVLFQGIGLGLAAYVNP